MAQGCQEDQWNHTAALMALLANINRPRNTRAFRPQDFHPIPRNPRQAALRPLRGDIQMLKAVFVDTHPRPRN